MSDDTQEKEFQRLKKLGRGIEPTLRIDELQVCFKISRRTCYRLIERGEIVAYKIGSSLRITYESVIDYQRRKIQEYAEREIE